MSHSYFCSIKHSSIYCLHSLSLSLITKDRPISSNECLLSVGVLIGSQQFIQFSVYHVERNIVAQMLLTMSKFKQFFLWTFSSILLLPDVVRSAPDIVVGEIFLDASTHVDFGSSFYNDIKFFFPNFNPEGDFLKYLFNVVYGQSHLM